MGQFNDSSQANRFYGPPPGYIGSDEGGQLTRAVLRQPKSVVLLDEMEKAHPKIWDAFLPVFDEGYIVDGSNNQKVDMTNTIIVLTSNLLAQDEGLIELPAYEIKDKLISSGTLRPELLGRINEILVFNALDRNSIAEILRRRMDSALWSLSEQGIQLSVEENEIMQLVDQVQRAKFGVRQIDDVVRTYLRKAISSQTSSPELD
jgi:ATP-dependent Clp protease ATP-binding subunit ClpA